MALTEGQTISHYRILGQLGSGGMGTVYKAQDLKLDRLVALKFLPPELGRDPEAKDRFIHEAKAASSLQHPNICVVFDIDETDDGQAFISMECLEGETLERMIRSGLLPLDRALNVVGQIAQGLSKAHAAGIIHRDIKPANIMVTQDGVAKLLDFGVAKSTSRVLQTGPGTVLGTAAYMSPEQARGAEADRRSDVWSLGVILYETITGRRPFAGDYEQAVLYGILHEEPQPPSTLRPELSPALEAVIGRCLAKAPEERFSDAGILAEELRRAIAGTRHNGKGAVPTEASKSIAVMPFADISADMDNKYFSDGLTDEIITKLSKLRKLKVVSRTSVMQYDRTGKPIRQIAGDLGVQYLLEGSVRKHGAQLRITTQLIDAGLDAYLWAETFDGTMGEVFDIQERVASRVVKALKVRLSPDEKRTLKRRATENTEAFQLYLKGRFFWNKRSREGLETAMRYFREAIDLDPKYAPAWVGIADCHILLTEYVATSRKEIFAKALEAVRKALEVDDRLAEAHASLGIITMLGDRNWKKAEQEYRTALSLDPNYATAHHWYAEWLSLQDRLTEALDEITLAASLDPVSPAIIKDKGLILYYGRDYDGAITFAQKALEMDAGIASAHRVLSLAYLAKGMFKEALAENERWGYAGARLVEVALGRALLHATAGNRPEALRILEALREDDTAGGNQGRGFALVYAALGEREQALEWLEKSYRDGEDSLSVLRADPKLDSLRGDPRFTELLRKAGFDLGIPGEGS
ncbi:MAG TPA: protein kinase [Bacteroidota bacterium]